MSIQVHISSRADQDLRILEACNPIRGTRLIVSHNAKYVFMACL